MDERRLVVGRGTPVVCLQGARPRGGVVLVSEVFGIDRALRLYAERLVAEDYAVAMPELWWRRPPPPMGSPEEIRSAVAELSDAEAMQDVAAARSTFPAHTRTFVLGFCLGGLYARMAGSALLGLGGVVEFYGRIHYPTITPRKPVQPLDLLPGLGCPIQCHYGTEDPVAPAAHVAELERRLAARGPAWQVFRYPGCGHGFMNPDRPAWNAEAAATAWARACNFLDQLAAVDP